MAATVVKKGKAVGNRAVHQQEEIVTAVMVVLDKPEPIKHYPKAKRHRLSNARLRKLAEKYKPPQSWFDKDADGEFFDLSPMTIDVIQVGNRVLQINPPLVITPVPDNESQQLLVAEDKSIDLHAFARTREQLKHEVSSQLVMLWDEYGREKPARLTKAAQAVQAALKKRIKETKHAKV